MISCSLRTLHGASLSLLMVGLLTGCSAHRKAAPAAMPDPIPTTASPSEAPEAPVAEQTVPTDEAPVEDVSDELMVEPTKDGAAAETADAQPVEPGLRDLCRQLGGKEDPLLDRTRRMLVETFCGANLWFDGLFGGEPDVENARQISGRVEVSTLYTDFEGFDPKVRLRLRYDLPNLENRANLFLGREDEDEFIEDRKEGFAVRSSVFDLETEERWLAGLGYSPPGRWGNKADFRVGGRLKTAPEIFFQGRYRHHIFVGEKSVWRFRETLFWENRDGFGTTTKIDYDRVLRSDLLLRLDNVGTISEATPGLAWRSTMLLYHNLRKSRAVAGEVFLRGSTDAEVPLREYGTRAIYRRPMGKPYLFGELIAGYTWPRRVLGEPRDGSTTVGIGFELLFGRDPF